MKGILSSTLGNRFSSKAPVQNSNIIAYQDITLKDR